jgi:hypothetical protein
MADGLLNKASIILTPTGYKAGTLYNVAPVVEPYEDFDFARASVASRVNSSGLVEMVGRTLSSELVTCGDFSCVDPEDDWNTTGTWQISGGTASSTANGSTQYLGQDVGIDVGKTYKITYTVITNTLSNDRLLMSGTSSFASTQIPSAIGPNTVYLTASQEPSSGYDVRFANSATNTSGSISIDNVSVKEVIDTNNIPRISYDSNGDNGHILLEPTSTNLLPYSEDFSQWNQVSNAVVTDNFTTSPDGTQNASKFTFDGTTNGRVENALTVTSGNQYTFSVWLKNDNLADPTQVWLAFSTFSQGEYVTVTNEWQRFTTTQTADGTTEFPRIQTSEIGSIFAWGAQFEELPYATSYIPTLTGSQEVRETETATGAGSADLINSTEGVLYAELAALDDGISQQIGVFGNSTSKQLRIEIANSVIRAQLFNGAYQANMSSTQTVTNFNKIAFKWKVNDFALWINGTEVATDSSGSTFPANDLDRLNLSGQNGIASLAQAKIKSLAVFNEALSDSELTQLTT